MEADHEVPSRGRSRCAGPRRRPRRRPCSPPRLSNRLPSRVSKACCATNAASASRRRSTTERVSRIAFRGLAAPDGQQPVLRFARGRFGNCGGGRRGARRLAQPRCACTFVVALAGARRRSLRDREPRNAPDPSRSGGTRPAPHWRWRRPLTSSSPRQKSMNGPSVRRSSRPIPCRWNHLEGALVEAARRGSQRNHVADASGVCGRAARAGRAGGVQPFHDAVEDRVRTTAAKSRGRGR